MESDQHHKHERVLIPNKSNVVGFFQLLYSIDKRNNPERYKRIPRK